MPPEVKDEQRLSLLLEIYSVHARMGTLVERELVRLGVEPAGYAALSAIGAFGPIRLTELAALLGMPLTTMSDLVQRLARRGLVQKDPHPDDGRSSLLRLSTAGDHEWKTGWPALREATAAIVNRLEAPEEDVRVALRRLGTALEQALTDT